MQFFLRNRLLRHFAVACAIMTLCFHPLKARALFAEHFYPQRPNTTSKPIAKPRVIDLCVPTGTRIEGRLVTPRGTAVSGANVAIQRGSESVFDVLTDSQGQFSLPAFDPGVYILTDGTWIQPIRIWAEGTAPPVAKTEMLVVAREPIVAGQVSPLRYWMANPNVMLATAAIAIAVPVLIYRPASD
ncbi:MAG: carboxypeptidase-like regulatory domain-containing protein [Planctomycetota bacterium]|nr:carboxypeptidase-like regulatory domain-containing protein [Planctomycetota bacterium]